MKSIILNCNFCSRKRRYFYIIQRSEYHINIMSCVIFVVQVVVCFKTLFLFHSLIIRTYMYYGRLRRVYTYGVYCIYMVTVILYICSMQFMYGVTQFIICWFTRDDRWGGGLVQGAFLGYFTNIKCTLNALLYKTIQMLIENTISS